MLFIMLLIILLVVVWFHSREVMKDNTIDTTKKTLSIFSNNIENVLDNADRTLRIIMNSVGDIYTLGSEKESTRYYAAIRLREVLDNCQLNNQDIDVLAIYNGEYKIYLSGVSNRINYDEKQAVQGYILDKASDKQVETYEWKIAMINHHYYITRVYEKDNRILSILIRIDNLLNKFQNNLNIGNQYYVLTTLEGEIVGSVGNSQYDTIQNQIDTEHLINYSFDKKHIIVTVPFSNKNFKMSCFIKVDDLYGKMQFIQICIILLIAVSIVFIIKFAGYVNREIFHPIKKLLAAMNYVEKGEYDYRIKERSKSREFDKVNSSFNSMIEEITNLKIETYEEKIQLQEAELHYVHLQIKPHFFLNAMTTIHSMSYQNRNEDIRTYIDALSKNVRYLFRAGLYTVPLKEEIVHIENYFMMQDLLYPDCVFYYIDIEEGAKEWKIPQLLLHTFIENEFKHAVSLEKLLSIFIRIHIVERNKISMAHIIIEDDGTGFSEDILKKLNANEIAMKENGQGVGLWNVKKTMELLYKRNDLMYFSNNEPHGIKIEIWIPSEIV